MKMITKGALCITPLLVVGACSTPNQTSSTAEAPPTLASSPTSGENPPGSGGLEVLRKEYTDLPAITTNSDAVVIAHAESSRVRTITGAKNGSSEPPPTLEETYTTVSVDKVVRGNLPAKVEVSQLGSHSGGYTEEGAPLLEAGTTYLLFLKKGPFGNYGVTGGRVVYEKTGSEFRRTAASATDTAGTAAAARGDGPAQAIPDIIPVNKVEAVVAAAAAH